MQQLIGFLPGNVKGVLSSSNCSFVGHITLREELFFVFLSEEEKRSLCLERVDCTLKPRVSGRKALLAACMHICLAVIETSSTPVLIILSRSAMAY